MNVLLTSASRKVWLVKAFQRALSEDGGGQVVAIDANPTSAALYFAGKSYVIPSGLREDFLEAVRNICIECDIKLLVPTRDEELPVFAAQKGTFESLGVTVVVPRCEVVERCQDKKAFIDFCLTHGFSIPKTYEADEVGRISVYPIFLKERFGKGSRSCFVAESRDELRVFLHRMKEPIIQEYVDAQEYTIDLFADFSGRVISAVPRERVAVFAGETFVGQTCRNWQLIEESIRLANVLGLTGHNTIQCFLQDGTVKFIEVNARFGGGASLGFAAGAFTPRYLVRLALGKTVESKVGQFEDGYMMLRYTEDLFIAEKEVLQFERVH